MDDQPLEWLMCPGQAPIPLQRMNDLGRHVQKVFLVGRLHSIRADADLAGIEGSLDPGRILELERGFFLCLNLKHAFSGGSNVQLNEQVIKPDASLLSLKSMEPKHSMADSQVGWF